MSDEDFMMSDAESFEFEFEDEEDDDPLGNGVNSDTEDLDQDDVLGGGSSSAIGSDGEEEDNAEALYYKAKHLKQSDLEKALAVFTKIIDINETKDEEAEAFKFKAIKQSLKVIYKLNHFEEFGATFDKFFTSVKLSSLNNSYVEQSFTRILDGYFGLPKTVQLETISTILSQYKINDRLKLKLSIKKFTILIEMGQFEEILSSLDSIYDDLNNNTASELNKSSNLLEFYAIELQLYLKSNNLLKLKEVYQKTLSIKHIVPHSKISAIIKESSGLICLDEDNFEMASSEFFESFKNYDEVGDNIKRMRILKYLIISSILNANHINKFESQEIQFFLKNEVVLKYLNLLKSFDSLNLTNFENQYNAIYSQEQAVTETDEFLLLNLTKIFKSFQLSFLIDYIKPFKKLSLGKVSRMLKIDTNEIESILVSLKFNNELPNITLDLIDGVIYNEY